MLLVGTWIINIRVYLISVQMSVPCTNSKLILQSHSPEAAFHAEPEQTRRTKRTRTVKSIKPFSLTLEFSIVSVPCYNPNIPEYFYVTCLLQEKIEQELRAVGRLKIYSQYHSIRL